MELYGLKTKDGKEYVLETEQITLGEKRGTEFVTYVKPVEPEPVFKVGDWAKYKPYDNTYDAPFKITSFNDDKGRVLGDNLTGRGEEWQCDKSDLCAVSPLEIESHLRKICDEKYIGNIADPLFIGRQERAKEFHHYDQEGDSIWYKVVGSHLFYCFYAQGKFAEIVRPVEKELPIPLKEFEELLNNWKYYIPYNNLSVEEFLREQGYKVD